eukprot:4539857-Prymnesium_polylepis.1
MADRSCAVVLSQALQHTTAQDSARDAAPPFAPRPRAQVMTDPVIAGDGHSCLLYTSDAADDM